MLPHIRTEVRPDGVAVLTFDQPDSKVNVLTMLAWADLEIAIDSLANRDGIRGLVLASAKPGVFIAGADLKLLANAKSNDPVVREYIEQGLRVLAKLEAVPFPTCAAIDGAALGGGLEVALACDYRIVGTDPRVQLGLPEVTVGLIPGWGGTQRLPRVIGLDPAGQMLMTGQTMTLQNASHLGIFDASASSADLIETAAGYLVKQGTVPPIREVRQGPIPLNTQSTARIPSPTAAAAIREVFRVMTAGAALPLTEGIKLETEAFMRLAGSPQSKHLIALFFASRKK